MRSIFEKDSFDEINDRIGKLTPTSERQWGKMSPSQALEHCAKALDAASGNIPVKQAFLGKLIGRFVKSQYTGDKPIRKNSPTSPEFVIANEPEFKATRERLRTLAKNFHDLGETKTDGNLHGFFGRLTGEEWGILQYKHLDHHLQQFGC